MGKSENWKKLLKADPTNWLLEESDPGVRYLALRDIVDTSGKELAEARQMAYNEGPIATILENMNPEGWWVKPGPGYLPKCRSTVWSLILLAQLGGSIQENERIDKACSYLLNHALLKGGQFETRGKPSNIGLCLQGNLLTALPDLGCKDERLAIAYEWMARRVIGEGLPRKLNNDGFAPGEGVPGSFRYVKLITDPVFGCRTNDNLSCGWAAVNVAMAFSRLPAENRTDLIEKAIQTTTDFFLSVDSSKAEFPGHRKGIPDKRWWQFGFPAFGNDILKIAEALTALGYGSDPRLANTLDLIREKQNKHGKWLLELTVPKNKMWVNFGSEGEPNKWVTLRAMRVLKQAYP
jgi:hypothetical protein